MNYIMKGKKAYDHQIKTLSFLNENHKAAVHSDPGTGKTRSLVCAAEVKKIQGKATRALYVCPDSVRESIGKEILLWTNCDVTVLSGSSVDRVKQLKETDTFFYVVNYDSCALIEKQLDKKGFDLLILDESTRVKNIRAQRSKVIARLASKCSIVWEATGSPLPNNPLDIHGQFSILDKRILGDQLYFKSNYVEYAPGPANIPVIAGYKNLEKLRDIIAKFAIRFRKADCLDLPDKVFIDYPVPLSEVQQKIYKDLEELFIAELPSGETVTITHVMAKFMRLHQVVSGFIGSGAEHEEFDNTRMSALEDLVQTIDAEHNKIIIWCSYTPSILRINKEFNNLNPALFYGGVKNKQEEIDKFNNDDSCRILIGNSKVGVGCTLNAASYTIYYELPYFDTEAMIQSQDRNHRIGQTKKVTYYKMISPGTIDTTIDRNLSRKFKLSSFLTGDDVKKILRGEV